MGRFLTIFLVQVEFWLCDLDATSLERASRHLEEEAKMFHPEDNNSFSMLPNFIYQKTSIFKPGDYLHKPAGLCGLQVAVLSPCLHG